MKSIVYIAQSLDGFIAGPDGELDWLQDIDNPEGSDFGFSACMESIDALIMGRNTFEVVVTFDFWPYTKPVFVASSSRKEIPSSLKDKAFLIQGTPKEMVAAMQAKGYSRLYVDGGILIQSFLKTGLIDELTVTTIPVLLGSGIRLFGHLEERIKLKLVNSEILANQLIKTTYQTVKA
jgi:dihydrofolate reductase